MSRTISIDDDIYQFLLENSQFESESEVLRRFLPIPDAAPSPAPSSSCGENRSSAALGPVSALSRLLADRVFVCRSATDKYLAVLELLFTERSDEFARIIELKGRERRYFGRSSQEIENSGTSTHPRPIPNSPYWAMTNADTNQKRAFLRKAMEVLAYSPSDIVSATKAIF